MLTQLEQIIHTSYKANKTVEATAKDLEMDKHTVASILRSIAAKDLSVTVPTFEVRERPAHNGEKKVTNASLVRDQIRELKDVLSKEEVEEVVVEWCIDTLGQSRALAKIYFANNWDKV